MLALAAVGWRFNRVRMTRGVCDAASDNVDTNAAGPVQVEI